MASEQDRQGRGLSHWEWRLHMAERVAAQLDPARFGVKAVYVIGSTKRGTAGPSSDIDLLVHFRGSAQQLSELKLWLEGWSLALDEANYLRTGLRTGGILDVHVITDDDVKSKSSFALKVSSSTDPARNLPMKPSENAIKSNRDGRAQDPPDQN